MMYALLARSAVVGVLAAFWMAACGESAPNPAEEPSPPRAENEAVVSDEDPAAEAGLQDGGRSIAIRVVERSRQREFLTPPSERLHRLRLRITFTGQSGDVPFIGYIISYEDETILNDLYSVTEPLEPDDLVATTDYGIRRPGIFDVAPQLGDRDVHHVEPGELVILAHVPRYRFNPAWTAFAGFLQEEADVPDLERFSEIGIDIDEGEEDLNNLRRSVQALWGER